MYFEIDVPVYKFPLTLKHVLQVCIRSILKMLRNQESNTQYHRNFVNFVKSYGDVSGMFNAKSTHIVHTNEIIQRFIAKFVIAVENNLKQDSVEPTIDNKMLMIYTNILKPTYVSGYKTKLLHIQFIKEKSREGFIHSEYPSPLYFAIESQVLQSINFQIFDNLIPITLLSLFVVKEMLQL